MSGAPLILFTYVPAENLQLRSHKLFDDLLCLGLVLP